MPVAFYAAHIQPVFSGGDEPGGLQHPSMVSSSENENGYPTRGHSAVSRSISYPIPPSSNESVSNPVSMSKSEERRVKFRKAQSTADIDQVRLGHGSNPAKSDPIFSAPSTTDLNRPLPEFHYDDYASSIHDSTEAKPDPSKVSYFLDGKRKVDFVLVYREEHDEYLVTASPAKEATLQRQFYLDQLQKAELALEYYRHRERTGEVLVFIKIHVPWAVLCREAERLRMRMPLIMEDPAFDDEEEERKRSWWHFFNGSKYESNRDEEDDDADDPSSFGGRRLTWTFDRQHLHMFKVDHPDTFFQWRHRTEIVKHILQECRNDRKHDRRHGIDPMLERGLFDAAFPLHDGSYGSMHPYTHGSKAHLSARQRLHIEWAGWTATFKPQPLNRIRNYFGEKFGFYFAFLDFYTKMLIFPSAFGLLAFVYGLISTETTHKDDIQRICDPHPGETGSLLMCPICNPPNCAPVHMQHDCELSRWQVRLDNEATLMVSCATLVWCALFIKLWKRREASLAVDWDTYQPREEASTHTSHVAIRAAYEEIAAATKRSNPVTMEPESYVPRHTRLIRAAASIAVATLLLIAAGGSLIGLIVSRIALYGAFRRLGEPFSSGNVEWSRWTVHGLIFCMVAIFEWIYDNIADRLTELECPKTNEQFLRSHLWKIFIFEELVDLLPIAYAAWFRGRGVTPKDLTFHSEICEPNGCMSEVAELVAVLLLARLVIGNIAEIAYPALKTFTKATFRKFANRWSSKGKANEDAERNMPQWLKDYHLNVLKLDGVAEEYMEMMIQFSFVAFFMPAFPLIPLVCFLNNVAEIRVDSINFLASHRRPVPMRVSGLQIWNKFMEIILKVAVLCNAALIAFTSEVAPRLYYQYVLSTSNVTRFGYKAFSFSKMAVTDWPELKDYLKGHPIEDLAFDPHRAPVIRRALHEDPFGNDTMEAGTLFNDTHTHCYYLDFRRDRPPYGYSPTWWKIFCIRVATFTAFVIIFYILLFLCDFAISDVPDDVMKRLKRREYLVNSKWMSKKRQRDDDNAVTEFTKSRWLRIVKRATILIPPVSPHPTVPSGTPFDEGTRTEEFLSGQEETPV